MLRQTKLCRPRRRGVVARASRPCESCNRHTGETPARRPCHYRLKTRLPEYIAKHIPGWKPVLLHARQQRFERALGTERVAGAAEMFSNHHELGVVVLPIVESTVRRWPVQRRLAHGFQIVIRGVPVAPLVPMKNPLRVSVDNKTA